MQGFRSLLLQLIMELHRRLGFVIGRWMAFIPAQLRSVLLMRAMVLGLCFTALVLWIYLVSHMRWIRLILEMGWDLASPGDFEL